MRIFVSKVPSLSGTFGARPAPSRASLPGCHRAGVTAAGVCPRSVVVPSIGFEPTTFCSGGRRSIP